jgi:hypothetical protein
MKIWLKGSKHNWEEYEVVSVAYESMPEHGVIEVNGIEYICRENKPETESIRMHKKARPYYDKRRW